MHQNEKPKSRVNSGVVKIASPMHKANHKSKSPERTNLKYTQKVEKTATQPQPQPQPTANSTSAALSVLAKPPPSPTHKVKAMITPNSEVIYSKEATVGSKSPSPLPSTSQMSLPPPPPLSVASQNQNISQCLPTPPQLNELIEDDTSIKRYNKHHNLANKSKISKRASDRSCKRTGSSRGSKKHKFRFRFEPNKASLTKITIKDSPSSTSEAASTNDNNDNRLQKIESIAKQMDFFASSTSKFINEDIPEEKSSTTKSSKKNTVNLDKDAHATRKHIAHKK